MDFENYCKSMDNKIFLFKISLSFSNFSKLLSGYENSFKIADLILT